MPPANPEAFVKDTLGGWDSDVGCVLVTEKRSKPRASVSHVWRLIQREACWKHEVSPWQLSLGPDGSLGVRMLHDAVLSDSGGRSGYGRIRMTRLL